MEPNHTPFIRVNLSNLLKLSGGDSVLELKYITNFLASAPAQLANIENALAKADSGLLYSTLHLLNAQLQFYGIKSAFEESKNVQEKLQANREITGEIKKLAGFILKEITLACAEFEAIKKSYS